MWQLPLTRVLNAGLCTARGHARAAAPDRPPGGQSPAARVGWLPPLVSRTPVAHQGGDEEEKEPKDGFKKCQSVCRALTLLPGSAAAAMQAECLAIMASRSAYSLRCTYVTWSQNIRARRWYLHEQVSISSNNLEVTGARQGLELQYTLAKGAVAQSSSQVSTMANGPLPALFYTHPAGTEGRSPRTSRCARKPRSAHSAATAAQCALCRPPQVTCDVPLDVK